MKTNGHETHVQTCDIQVWPSAHRLSGQHIWDKFRENPLKNVGDIERTPKCYGQADKRTAFL